MVAHWQEAHSDQPQAPSIQIDQLERDAMIKLL
jgi:hypothetical protein